MKVISKGTTRWVIFLGDYAIKIPSLMGYTYFLHGLLANIYEKRNYEYAKQGFYQIEKFCPIVFFLPLGIMSIMKKTKVLSIGEYASFDYNSFCKMNEVTFNIENKNDSFGYLNGRIVAIDYE
jgi:hypothetical protein